MADFEKINRAQAAILEPGCEMVTFDHVVTGTNGFVTAVMSSPGSEQIMVHAYQRTASGSYRTNLNVANIFDSSQDWSQHLHDMQVVDILTPHQDFGGGGVGAGGARGSAYANDSDLGDMMIINRFDEANKPYDNNSGGMISFDFSSMGTVTMSSITVLDVDSYEGASKIELFGANGNLLSVVPVQISESNGKQIVDLGNTAGVARMVVHLGPDVTGASTGSGAVDNIVFCRPPQEYGCTYTQGYWKNHATGKKADAAWNGMHDDQFYQSGSTYLQVLNTAPKGGNAYYILAHQFIAAKLNMVNASSTPEVTAAFNSAEAYFSTATPANPYGAASRADLIRWAGILADYNEGRVGPGHCD
ncbi:hypothetical protein GCM10007389_30570 [Pontibacter akesuensis]|nr:hypothetical protein GCM10007389_30570 [Pontibacter akesuensis]